MPALRSEVGSSRAVVVPLVLAIFCASVLWVVAAPGALAAPQSQRPDLDGYRPPSDRVVVDPFRRPLNPFAAGNRGLEYGTVPGDPLRAIGDGVVSFAGRIAGRMYVTITHPDGLRSSTSFLSRLAVRRGDVVRSGQVLGWAGTTNAHLGVRVGGLYLDPASLFGAALPRHAVLVSGSPVVGGR